MTDHPLGHGVDARAPSYLIFVQSPVVSLDIGLVIQDLAPGANIIVVQNATTALRALARVSSLQAAFLELAPASDTCCRLAEATRLRGGLLVLLGDEAEDMGPSASWSVLVRPFTTRGVLAALGVPRQGRCGRPMRSTGHLAASRLAAPGVGVALLQGRITDAFAR